MRFGIFSGGGFNLPPGCGKLPGEEEYPCEVCGEFPDDCICPECPVCKTQGDPDCYKNHGLVLTKAQKKSKRDFEKREKVRLKKEWEFAKEIMKDLKRGKEKRERRKYESNRI